MQSCGIMQWGLLGQTCVGMCCWVQYDGVRTWRAPWCNYGTTSCRRYQSDAPLGFELRIQLTLNPGRWVYYADNEMLYGAAFLEGPQS
jgi:hypothetical protein